jgi:hypothetical protein
MPSTKRKGKTMKQYRKKPVVIEAERFTRPEKYNPDLKCFGQEVFYNESQDRYFILISTLEGVMTANEGDWIIKGVSGEFYPCKKDIFEKTYEEVRGQAES